MVTMDSTDVIWQKYTPVLFLGLVFADSDCFFSFPHQAFKEMLYAAQDQAPSIEGKKHYPVWTNKPRQTDRHTHCTQCPLLWACLGIPRITALHLLKIGGNGC